MPRAGTYANHKPRDVEKAVRRHLEGNEPIADLAKELKVSRQTLYSWVDAYKKRAMESIDRIGKSKAELDKVDKAQLIAQNETLQTENRKLRDRLVNLMMKYGEIP
jgi:transposase-like protein